MSFDESQPRFSERFIHDLTGTRTRKLQQHSMRQDVYICIQQFGSILAFAMLILNAVDVKSEHNLSFAVSRQARWLGD